MRYFKKKIKKIKRWAKQKIKNTFIELETERSNDYNNSMESFPYLIYFPHENRSDSYIINKPSVFKDVCEQGLPVPPSKLWLGYGSHINEYLKPGKDQVAKMLNIVKDSGFDFSGNKKILDFGCGAGRMIRWLKPLSGNCEIWGTDISAELIHWANNHLKPPFNFATTTTIPHLPFEDKYFDFIYAGSVFTHSEDLSDAWFLELKRILSDDGRIYVTIHDKHCIELLKTVPVFKDSFLYNIIFENELYKESKGEFGMFVAKRGPASQVFYDIDFFCNSVKSYFDVLSITEEAYGYQTAVLLKKKSKQI